MAAYQAALEQFEPAKRPARASAIEGSFSALAARYFGSPQFAGLSDSSRKNYRRVIDGFLVEHGHRQVSQFRREHVDYLIGKMAGSPGAGIILLKRIRTLVRYGLQLGWIDRDPTAGATSYASKEIHTWTESEIGQFRASWTVGTKQRLGFELLLGTGQRGSDVHRMTWADIAGDAIRVVQQKTATKLTIPLHPELQAVLRVALREHVAILATAFGKPFTVKGFGQLMSDAIGKAGLPERCKAHGLRKAAARRLAEAGCSEKQIAAITGHKTLAEIERYTRAADQEKLARQAITMQSKGKRTGRVQPVANRTSQKWQTSTQDTDK